MAPQFKDNTIKEGNIHLGRISTVKQMKTSLRVEVHENIAKTLKYLHDLTTLS